MAARVKTKRFWIRVALLSGLLYFALVFVFIATQLCDRLCPASLCRIGLFYPVKASSYPILPGTYGSARRMNVSFAAPSGARLQGVFYDLKDASRVVLLCYGQSGNIGINAGLLKAVLDSGCSVFAYDYEGYGMSTGTPSPSRVIEDGVAAYDYLSGPLGVEPSRIVEMGVSLGTGIASRVAEQRAPQSLVLISPYVSLRRLAREKLPFLRLYGDGDFPAPDLGAGEFFAKNSEVPVLMLHGELDPIIPAGDSRDLFAMSRSPCRLVMANDAHHCDFSLDFITGELKSFFDLLDRGRLESKTSVASGL